VEACAEAAKIFRRQWRDVGKEFHLDPIRLHLHPPHITRTSPAPPRCATPCPRCQSRRTLADWRRGCTAPVWPPSLGLPSPVPPCHARGSRSQATNASANLRSDLSFSLAICFSMRLCTAQTDSQQVPRAFDVMGGKPWRSYSHMFFSSFGGSCPAFCRHCDACLTSRWPFSQRSSNRKPNPNWWPVKWVRLPELRTA
jgi:hypothetical protein